MSSVVRARAAAVATACITAGVAGHALAQNGGAVPPAARSSQSAPRVLRVCSDPNNLPFSNEKGEGFENKIAELLARRMGARLEYRWAPQRRGFVRTTLNAGECDLVMGVPSEYDPVRTTRPYYRSTYVFVTRASGGPRVRSLADTVLRRAKIGIHLTGESNPPAAQALAELGIIDNVVGYTIYGDYSQPNPPARLVEAVAKDDVDVAIVWGPLGGYFAKRQRVPLALAPVPSAGDVSGQQWTFAIAMGVRRRDQALAAEVDRLLVSERASIRRILNDYGVPLLPIEQGSAPSNHSQP